MLINTWDNSFKSVGINGRWTAFGGLTAADCNLCVLKNTIVYFYGIFSIFSIVTRS
jgi:hypothetical protein